MKTFFIEVNKEQPEWKVVQTLVQLGLQKACWDDEMNTSFVEVCVGIKTFSNYSSKMQKENTLTLEKAFNLCQNIRFID